MKKRYLVITVIALVMVALAGLPALAAAGHNPLHRWVRLSGEGTLRAGGDGLAAIRGDGRFYLAGTGSLLVKAADGTEVQTEGFGRRQDLGNGWVLYAGQGEARISGRAAVAIAGADLRLQAAGEGGVLLVGHGRYQTSGGRQGTWWIPGANAQGEEVELPATEAADPSM